MGREMRRSHRGGAMFLFVVLLLVIVLVSALVIGLLLKHREKEKPDPHAGQVYLYDGNDWTWMTPLEGVPTNTLTAENFSDVTGQIRYTGDRYTVVRGVDVSEHQLEIDWQQVASSGISYAYIRLGWRGYTEGGLFEDAWYKANMKGAAESGLRCGVYFFSQAVTVAEAIEEAEFVLDRLADYRITMPVVYDWEYVDAENARTNGLTVDGRTDCAVAFCETIRRAGYTPCVYFNRKLGYYGYDLTRLTDYDFWFSLPESPFPNFYYACDMWQYSFTESVPGIREGTDMNLWFIPNEPVTTPEPEIQVKKR